ncbi:MAG: pyrroloquinoline quinone biosynthesis peptide chaperone PqqD [Rhodospirillaceae bacterium]|nr:pyrroloquinoline quinone biosynthesis peptide chaperone PqqD [Rhodospirillaceae bacterium]
MSERTILTEDSVPKLPRHAKLRFDKPRDKWIILAPERVFELDPIASEVVRLCDGSKPVNEVVDTLAAKYEAPRDVIAKDVIDMLQGLADKGFVVT